MEGAETRMDLAALSHSYGIALTGGIATGKSTIAAVLRRSGQIVIDADQLSRAIVLPGTEGLAAITAHFGPAVLKADGHLDRTAMRRLIFSDDKQRLALEAIIHPRLTAATQAALAAAGLGDQAKIWFYEAALILERGRGGDFREVWVASCPEDVQLQRLMTRDHSSREEAQAIIKAQMPMHQKLRAATRVIDTDCSMAELELRTTATLTALLQSLSHSSP